LGAGDGTDFAGACGGVACAWAMDEKVSAAIEKSSKISSREFRRFCTLNLIQFAEKGRIT
jgi:hypothetical protein